ncbi:MAG: DUF1059 domain-containing protein [Chloroflexi bacterium]|nr:DUF1059 domain-containing protein [Chloroflexota bacterium]MBT4074346.1 DUF1059 domain-containing protein [Chloroflexota bacterium]MBT4514699.1 DUF1059 domain-containing protein [Chloroflexota bacterium]MBT6681544.1 DUF1059 domain-containing protein [Chloroflexota bacterium]
MFSISCIDLGSSCTTAIRGDNVDQLIADMQDHGRTYHGYSEEEITSPRMRARMKIAIMHSTRPPEQRTTHTEGWWRPHVEPVVPG